MRSFKPLKQNRISEEVLRQLKEAILLGEFKLGEKLPSERELTAQFQVSRGVVREAIRMLEVTGFVITRQGPAGGAFVTKPSFDHVGNAFLDLFLANKLSIPELAHVRRIIEPEVAYLAANNITDEGGALLNKAQENEFTPFTNYSDRITKNQEVHRLLAEICGNHFLEAISNSLLKLTREVVDAIDPDHEKLHSPGEHRRIIDAVLDGNASEAASEMAKHMDIFYERLCNMEEDYRLKTSPNMRSRKDN
jgi:DNA-binding FadR family transcriptional regulator